MSLLVGFKAGFQLKYLFRKSWISSCRLLAGLSHHVVPGSAATPFTDKPSFFAPQWNIFQIKASGGEIWVVSPYTKAKNLVITERETQSLFQIVNIEQRELCLTSKCDQYLSSKIFCKNTPGDESVNQNPNKALSGSDPYHGWGVSLGGGEGGGSTLIYVIWLWLQMRCAFKQTQTQIRWA